jgi:hypothetical protein
MLQQLDLCLLQMWRMVVEGEDGINLK